ARLLVAALLLTGTPFVRPAAASGDGGESCWPGEPGSDPRLCPPDDPTYPRRWEFRSDIPASVDRENMHPSELELGSIGFSLDRAWQRTTGRDDVVIAVLDSGIRWHYRDLVEKIYLNAGELPLPESASTHDRNGDGIFTVEDYEGDSRVGDRNGNGTLDAQDLIRAFSDCRDDDANGYPDDIAGYDFFAGSHCGLEGADNDAADDTDFGHGTEIASTAAAETNNGVEDAGVCPACRVLPVRVGDSFVVDANQFARGVVFAVDAGATVIASALGSYNNTPAARAAVDYAYEHGVTLIASAADEFSYHHNYPSVYNHALYVNAIRNNANDTTFWGLNPCTNFGARVWATVPARSCSSGATSRLSGVAGLIHSAALDAGLGKLHAEEVYQLIRLTADDLDNSSPDWGELRYPAREGFDQLTGYGRLNAHRAVRAVHERRIPPRVDLHNPRWFAIVSPRDEPTVEIHGSIRLPRAERAGYELAYALGVEPLESDYRTVARGTVQREMVGPLGGLDFSKLPVPEGPAPRTRDERDRYSVTLRLRVIDDRGVSAEARRSFFVFHDPTWKRGFPIDLGASGEAAPSFVDLDEDGRDEIVLPTADGLLRILSWDDGELRSVTAELDALAGRPAHRETIIRGASIGKLAQDDAVSIVVASRSGKVYAFDRAGQRREGFPVSVRPDLAHPATKERRVERGVLSRPVLVDLDGKPGAEIVVSALDGHVYAWRHDGALLGGFPVRVAPAAETAAIGKIVSTPAVGDIDGDGRPEIVVGSNRLHEGLATAYAIRSDGNLHPGGPFVPGWRPFELPAIRPDLLPTMASGLQMSPVLVDVDGDLDEEVVLYAVTGNAVLLVDQPSDGPARIAARYSLAPGTDSELQGTTFLGGTGSPLVADTDGDGHQELYAPLLPFRMLTLRSKPAVPIDVPLAVGAWLLDGESVRGSVSMLRDYPRRMEDLMLYASPIAGDVDADGIAEVLIGSGGYLLHGFARQGGEPEGFPKFTGGWVFSAPDVGDLDGDGRQELIAVTREGYLFAWELLGEPDHEIAVE
nr:S8 family serine peptidase [Acidobacteriota bacterium]NIM63428.1 S8 family serine peptidase [Acidobacteriota bacterium]NIO58359.1 S8 family serine peptidase [Acidobacteriota bacterium]NIQ84030.1 S8 family serine peptidase [Acidobacteriota bacterium]NIT10128.1 S8 family serine peptidase [Acidobacteriota bacterium]